MQRTDSLEKTLMLGKAEGGRRRGWQRMRCLDGITESVDMTVSKFWKMETDWEGLHAAGRGMAESDTTECLNNSNCDLFLPSSLSNPVSKSWMLKASKYQTLTPSHHLHCYHSDPFLLPRFFSNLKANILFLKLCPLQKLMTDMSSWACLAKQQIGDQLIKTPLLINCLHL